MAIGLKKAIPCRKVGVAVLGLEVPHAHIHLIPMQTEADMDFRKEKLNLLADRMAEIARAIAAQID